MTIWYNFKAIWYSLWPFGVFFPFWYVWTEKNLATLLLKRTSSIRDKKRKYKNARKHDFRFDKKSAFSGALK
jgi:hypothetical protein